MPIVTATASDHAPIATADADSRNGPLVALALLSMAWGAWLGLLRLGWALPILWPDQLILHGPLMIGGFVGARRDVGALWRIGPNAHAARPGSAAHMMKHVAVGWLIAGVFGMDAALAQATAGNPASPTA